MKWWCCFFFNDTATTEIYTLSLHDALPISAGTWREYVRPGETLVPMPPASDLLPDGQRWQAAAMSTLEPTFRIPADRKSTRLNSSHANISYAVFCLKKKKTSIFVHLHVTTR